MCSGVEHMWVIAKTKPNQEKRAKINIENQGFVTYMPLYRCMKYKKNSWVVHNEILFKGYLFIKSNSLHSITKVNNTIGISQLLTDYLNYQPQIVSDDIILELKARVHSMTDGENNFKKHDKVQIINGPHNKLHAIFLEKTSCNRSKILINILNNERIVKISSSNIQLAF